MTRSSGYSPEMLRPVTKPEMRACSEASTLTGAGAGLWSSHASSQHSLSMVNIDSSLEERILIPSFKVLDTHLGCLWSH